MNCIEFEAALERGVETRKPLDTALIEHASACAACRADWDIHRQLEVAVTAWRFDLGIQAFAGLSDQHQDAANSFVESVSPPRGLADSVLEECLLRDHRSQPVPQSAQMTSAIELVTQAPSVSTLRSIATNQAFSPHSRSAGFSIACVSACLLVAVLSTIRMSERNQEGLARVDSRLRTQGSIALPSHTHSSDAQATVNVSETLNAVISDLRFEYDEMATETKIVAREFVRVIPNRLPVVSPREPEEVPDRPSTSEVVRIWQPIGSRVESALGFLWQAVPSEVPSG